MNFSINNDLKFLIPEIFLLLGILYIIIFASIYSNKAIYRYTKLLKPIMYNSVLIIIIYVLLLLNSIDHNNIISSYLLVNNYLTLIIKLLLSFLLIILLLSSYTYLINSNIYMYEVYILIMISFLGMVILVMSYDLIIMYLAIELQSLCFYILTAINRNLNRSIEAGLKYYILGSFSSSLLILGIAIIYGLTGMTNFKDLSDLLLLGLDSVVLNFCLFLGVILINIGFFFKLSLAPFHIWLPDIFDGSIKVVVAIFSTLPKIALIFIIYQFYNVLLMKLLIEWEYYSLIFVILSWIIGIMGALRVNKINKLLAYSSINHMGFLILSVLINNMESFIIYLFLYNSITVTIFIILFSVCKYNKDVDLNDINQFIYLYKSNTVLASSFILILFSLAGIPPLAGFFSKYILVMAALQLNWYLIIFIGLILSIISCFYYLRLGKILMFNNNNLWVFFKDIPKVNSYIISYSILFNLNFILFLPIIHEFLTYIGSQMIIYNII